MYKKIKPILSNAQYYISKKEWEDERKNCPDYPQIDVLSDLLSQFGVKNYIVKVPVELLDQLPTLFISILEYQNTVQTCIVSLGKNSIEVSFFNGKSVNFNKYDFLEIWSGVLINIEKNENKAGIIYKPKKAFNLYKPLFCLQLLIITILWISYAHNLSLTLLFFTNIIGTYLSWSAFKVSLGYSNEQIEKVCSIIKSGNCSLIIRSSQSKIYKNISLSDLSLSYFIGSTIVSLIAAVKPQILTIYSILLVPLIIISLYSIYQQIKVIQKKCLVCFGIIITCIFQNIIILDTISSYDIDKNIYLFLFIFLFSISGILWIKEGINSFIELKYENFKMSGIYRDPDVFNQFFWDSKVFSSDEINKIPKLKLNNTSENNLLYILSPNCPYCKEEFSRILNLVRYNGSDFCINIALQISESNDRNLLDFVSRVFELQNDKPTLITALADYFEQGFSVGKWLKKWGRPTHHIEVEELLYVNNFINNNGISAMPIVIANTKLFPSTYNLKDIKFFTKEIFRTQNI